MLVKAILALWALYREARSPNAEHVAGGRAVLAIVVWV